MKSCFETTVSYQYTGTFPYQSNIAFHFYLQYIYSAPSQIISFDHSDYTLDSAHTQVWPLLQYSTRWLLKLWFTLFSSFFFPVWKIVTFEFFTYSDMLMFDEYLHSVLPNCANISTVFCRIMWSPKLRVYKHGFIWFKTYRSRFYIRSRFYLFFQVRTCLLFRGTLDPEVPRQKYLTW